MKKLSNIYFDLFENNITSRLKTLKILLEREIKVGDTLNNKLKTVNNDLSNSMLKFLNSDKIKDVNVDYVDYNSDNAQLLTLGFKDREGNERTRLIKVTKLLSYLGANVSDIKGYDIEELISHLQKGSLDDFKIVNGADILKAYHCENYDEGENMGSCMRFTSAQKYLEMYTKNPNQISCLVLFNPKNKKVRGRALIWAMDDGSKFIDRIYTTNKEYSKDFNAYISKYNLNSNSPDGDVTLEHGGEYDYYPYMDTLMYYTPDTGILNDSSGEIELQDTEGGESTGSYSEVHDTRIPEDEAAYVEHIEDYVYDHEVEESWERDGTYLYRDAADVKEITKGNYKGWYGLEGDLVEDYDNEIIVGEECYMIEAGENEGYWAFEDEVIQDFEDRPIMRYEGVTATIGSKKGTILLDEDAYIFTSGPNKGKIFHESDESGLEGKGEYEYVPRVLGRDDYVLNESKKLSLNTIFKEIINESSIFTENDGGENCDCCKYFDFTHSQAGASYGGLTHPIYHEIEKGIRHELKYVSPEKYMREIAKGFGMSYEESLKSHAIRWHLVKEYAQSMLNGEKFPIGFYQSSGSQEGRHRALAAMELGCNMMPVILFTSVSRDEATQMVISYKGLDRETINQIYVDKGYEGISDLDWRTLQNFINYRL